MFKSFSFASNNQLDQEIDLAGGQFFVADDGHHVYSKVWQDPTVDPVAVVLMFHGIGEHINRYNHVFDKFAKNGIIVKGLDSRGHGRTHRMNKMKNNLTKEGYPHSFDRVWDDMLHLYEQPLPSQSHPVEHLKSLPTFVMGHSLGGIMGLGFAKNRGKDLARLDGVISQAPALGFAKPVAAPIIFAAKTLGSNIMARYQDKVDLEIEGLCTSQDVIDAYENDEYVHRMVTLRVVHDIIKHTDDLTTNAHEFDHPILIHHSVKDSYTSHDNAKSFFESISSKDKVFKSWEDVEHELHNEPEIMHDVINEYIHWITTRANNASEK